MRLPRSGTVVGALGRQLSALQRRRRLWAQQQGFRLGESANTSVTSFDVVRRRPPG